MFPLFKPSFLAIEYKADNSANGNILARFWHSVQSVLPTEIISMFVGTGNVRDLKRTEVVKCFYANIEMSRGEDTSY